MTITLCNISIQTAKWVVCPLQEIIPRLEEGTLHYIS